MERLREEMLGGGLPAFFDAAIRLVVTPDFISANAGAIAQMKRECVRMNSPKAILHTIDAILNFNVKDRVSQISLPTLIVSGREDIMTPIHPAKKIHQSIRNSEWRIIEGLGHNILIQDRVPELAKIILDFEDCD